MVHAVALELVEFRDAVGAELDAAVAEVEPVREAPEIRELAGDQRHDVAIEMAGVAVNDQRDGASRACWAGRFAIDR